jgi:hypothetical protein
VSLCCITDFIIGKQADWELVRPGLLAVKLSIPKEDLTAHKSLMDHLLVTLPI